MHTKVWGVPVTEQKALLPARTSTEPLWAWTAHCQNCFFTHPHVEAKFWFSDVYGTFRYGIRGFYNHICEMLVGNSYALTLWKAVVFISVLLGPSAPMIRRGRRLGCREIEGEYCLMSSWDLMTPELFPVLSPSLYLFSAILMGLR